MAHSSAGKHRDRKTASTEPAHTRLVVPLRVAGEHAQTLERPLGVSSDFARAPGAIELLNRSYALLLFGQIQLRVHEGDALRVRSVHLALGIGPDGSKEVAGLGTNQDFVESIRDGGIQDVFVAVTRGEKSLDAEVRRCFPNSTIQADIVELLHKSLDSAASSDRTPLFTALRFICRAANEASALSALEAFATGRLGSRYPGIGDLWRQQWPAIAAFVSQPPAVRRFLESANAVESFQEKLQRQAIKLPNQYPSIEAAIRHLTQLAQNCSGGWKVAPRKWMPLKAHFSRLGTPVRLR